MEYILSHIADCMVSSAINAVRSVDTYGPPAAPPIEGGVDDVLRKHREFAEHPAWVPERLLALEEMHLEDRFTELAGMFLADDLYSHARALAGQLFLDHRARLIEHAELAWRKRFSVLSS